MVNISRNTSQVCGMMGNKADATHHAVSRYIQLARTSESRCYALSYELMLSDGHASESRCCASGWTQGKGADTCSQPIYIKKHILISTH
jgi:hypothetical protein